MPVGDAKVREGGIPQGQGGLHKNAINNHS
jgi:hypothetical protein